MAAASAGDASTRIVRHYQDYICNVAKHKNVIACLPTGSGKTFIACLLIRHHAHEITAPFAGSGKRIFFLVPQKVLVPQQAEEIRKYSSFPEDVAELTGDNDTDNWTTAKWIDHLSKFRIFVMIHDIFLNLLSLGDVLPLEKISLIIFDEAHHAALRKKGKMTNHPYRRVLHKLAENNNPIRILGLTASLINNRISTLDQLKLHVTDLEEAFLNAECVIVDTAEVTMYKTNAKLIIWLCEDRGSLMAEGSDVLQELCKGMSEELKQRHKILEKLRMKFPIECDDAAKVMDRLWQCMNEMSMWIARELCREYHKELEMNFNLYEHSHDHYARVLQSLMTIISEICRNLSFQLDVISEKDQIIGIASAKLIRMLQLLKNYSNSSDNFRGIIFVETRLEAKAFAHWIQKASKLLPTLNFIRAEYMIGYSSRPGFVDKISRLSRQHQIETMKSFREGKLNLLIATSVLEEGLDVPECNCVIRYNLPDTYRSYQQSMGRARAKNAAFYMIAHKGVEEEKLRKDVIEFEKLGRVIAEICKQNKYRREVKQGLAADVSPEKETEMRMILEGQKVVDPVTGAEVTYGSAVSRVYEYLAQTSFGWTPRPDNKFVSVGSDFFCEVRLPLCSGIPDVIRGSEMCSELYAKKSAYLSVVRQLMERNLLDDHLKPMSKQLIVEKMLKQLNLQFARQPHVPGEPVPGTKRRKQVYEIGDPDRGIKSACLFTPYHLYRIVIRDPAANQETSHMLGLLSMAELPPQVLTSLTIYKKNRSVTVSIQYVRHEEMSPIHQQSVWWFHEFVFIAMLGFESKIEAGDSRSLLVCPLSCDTSKIDYKYIDSLRKNEANRAPLIFNESGFGISRSEKFSFDASLYEDAVVRHWYGPVNKEDPPVQHLRSWTKSWKVAAIELNLTDHIPFNDHSDGQPPQFSSETFAQYYKKYHLSATDATQKMLKVVPGSQIAWLTPNETTRKLKSIHYVPEFVEICPMSGSMWEKVSCLPVLLHRLRQMRIAQSFTQMLAHEVRQQIDPDHCSDHLNFASVVVRTRADADTPDREKSETASDTSEDEDPIYGPQVTEPQAANGSGDVVVLPPDYRSINQRIFSYIRRVHNNDRVREPIVFEPNQMFVAETFQSAVPLIRPSLNLFQGLQNVSARCKGMMDILISALLQVTGSGPANEPVQLDHKEPDLILKDNGDAFTIVGSFDQQPDSRSFPAGLFIEVFSTKHAHDVVNSERLETLGDSFLKFAVSSYLHARASDRSAHSDIMADSLTEGHLTAIKGQLVSNYNLYRLLKKITCHEMRFPCIMFDKKLDPKRNWLPPGFMELPGSTGRMVQSISDKTIADSIEALIGAIVLTFGDVEAIRFLLWMGLPVTLSSSEHLVRGQQWLPAIDPVRGEASLQSDIVSQKEMFYKRSHIQRLEKVLNYEFRNKWFAICAITHSSCCDNWFTGSYEKMEFLGDAVLDRLMATFCFQYKREDGTRLDPGEMTDLRSALVNNAYLGCLLVKFDLHKNIFLTAHELKNQIDTCAENLRSLADKPYLTIGSYVLSQSEEDGDGDCGSSLQQMEVPKILGDVMEALIGAVFLDSGRSLDAVWKIVYGLMEKELNEFTKDIPKNPIRRIYEADPDHKFYDKKLPDDDDKSYEITLTFKKKQYTGSGRSLRFARLHAAMKALNDVTE